MEEAKLAAIAAGETVQVYKVNWQGQEKRQGHTDQGAEQGAEANWCHLHELLKGFSKHNFSHSSFASVNGQLGCFFGLWHTNSFEHQPLLTLGAEAGDRSCEPNKD